MGSVKNLVGFTIGEVILLALVAVPLIVIQIVPEYKRGFFPDDTSIAYPMKPNTVSFVLAGVFGLGAPVLVMLIFELIEAYKDGFSFNEDSKLPRVVVSLYQTIGMTLFAFIALMLIIGTGKNTVGSLRPYFLEACKPSNYPAVGYQEVAHCTEPNEREIAEARVSFPSGHSATAVFGAVALSLYLQLRWPMGPAVMIKNFFQVGAASIAFYICLSRIQDNRHRAIDVVTGSILGALAAIMIFMTPVSRSARASFRHTFVPVSEPV